MPDPVTGLIAAGSQLLGGAMQSRAAGKAAGAQERAAEMGIEEQRRQFDEIQKLLSPYVGAGQQAISGFQPFQEAGAQAFEQQQALAGLRGPEAQQAAIAQIEQSPFLQAQIRQGEEAMLQRASATGGLRGGNIQAALAQFRPQMLQQAIEQQYGRLGGFAGTGLGVTEQLYRGGQASAANQASAAGTMGANVSNLLGQQGAAQAGASEPAEPAVLLLDGLLQHLRPELSQSRLDVAATQAARGRCALQHRLFALAHLGLEERTLLDLCNGRLLRLGAAQAR
jgi:hypothetical protein